MILMELMDSSSCRNRESKTFATPLKLYTCLKYNFCLPRFVNFGKNFTTELCRSQPCGEQERACETYDDRLFML